MAAAPRIWIPQRLKPQSILPVLRRRLEAAPFQIKTDFGVWKQSVTTGAEAYIDSRALRGPFGFAQGKLLKRRSSTAWLCTARLARLGMPRSRRTY
jgi:hypothetical protein